MMKVFERTDAFRRPERFEQFLLACEADARGRTSFENRDYAQAAHMRIAFAAASAVDAGSIASDNEEAKIPEAIRAARVGAVRKARNRN